MTLSVKQILADGNGRIEWLFNVGGLPWGICSHPSLIPLITATEKRIFFGAARYQLGSYPADQVPVLSGLHLPGRQTSRCRYEKGFEFGDIGLEIDTQDHGIDWGQDGYAFSTGTPSLGVLGLDTVPDVFADSACSYGYIGQDYGPNIDIYDEQNNGWGSKFVWIGNECVRVDSQGVSPSDKLIRLAIATGHSGTVMRGLFRSRQHTHFAGDRGMPGDLASTVPHGGIGGRFGYLWAIPCAEDLSEIGTPVLWQSGRIAEDVKVDTTVSLTLTGHEGSYKRGLHAKQTTGSLAGYLLTRGTEGCGEDQDDWSAGLAAAHIVIWEYWETLGVWDRARRNIWLCEKDSSVFFATLEDLLDAIDTELRAVSAGSGAQNSGDGTTGNPVITTHYSYSICSRGICTTDRDAQIDGNIAVGGQLPIVLDLVLPFRVRDDGHFAYSKEEHRKIILDQLAEGRQPWCLAFNYHTSPGVRMYPKSIMGLPWLLQRDGETAYADRESILGSRKPFELSAKYLYSYANSSTIADFWRDPQGPGAATMRFAVAEESGTAYFRFNPDYDLTQLSSGMPITMGRPSQQTLTGAVAKPHFARFYPGASSIVDGLGKLALSDEIGLGFVGPLANYACVQPVARGIWDSPFMFMGQLFWSPALFADDPWPVTQFYDVRTTTFSKMFRGILGDSVNGASIPEILTLSDVPDSVTTGDFVSIVDWDDLDDVLVPLVEGEAFSIYTDIDLPDVWDLLVKETLARGIVPYIYIDETSSPYARRVRWKQIGADENGRNPLIVDEKILTKRSAGVVNNSARWVYSTAKIRFNKVAQKFQSEMSVINRAAQSALGGRNVELKLDLHLTELWDNESLEFTGPILSQRIGQDLLRSIARSGHTITYTCSLAAASLSVGAVATVHDPYIRDPHTGFIGMGYRDCLVVSNSVAWSNGVCRVQVELLPSGDSTSILAPCMYVAIGDAQVYSEAVITIRQASYQYLMSGNGRLDRSWFDCLDWDQGSDTYTPRTCTCEDYPVTVITDTDSPIITSARIALDGTPGTGVTLSYINTALFPVDVDDKITVPLVIMFCEWDNPDIQPCQRRFAYFANDDNLLVEYDTTTTPGRRLR